MGNYRRMVEGQLPVMCVLGGMLVRSSAPREAVFFGMKSLDASTDEH
jgi:hypothetical protein